MVYSTSVENRLCMSVKNWLLLLFILAQENASMDTGIDIYDPADPDDTDHPDDPDDQDDPDDPQSGKLINYYIQSLKLPI